MQSSTPASPPGGIIAALDVVFDHPLQPAQQLVIERVRQAMERHTFELHDLSSRGEEIHRIAVATYIPTIAITYGEDPRQMTARFHVKSRAAKQVLVWTSSLFFQFLHYHVGRVGAINGQGHQMDWEAQQDPHAPARIRRWVEGGSSIIERLHMEHSQEPR